MGRIQDLRQGPDGFIYLVTDDRDGKPTPVPTGSSRSSA